MPPGDLDGRVVLVTGGSRGLGAASAVAAAHRGARVAVGYNASADAARDVVDRIHAHGGVAEAFAGDVGDPIEVQRLLGSVQARLGPIDGVVNSAAAMLTRPFLETDDGQWEEILRQDLYSVIFTCRGVLPSMLERGAGTIVNVTSRLAFVGTSDAPAYAAAKAAVGSLTKSLAAEFGPSGVRVNAVAPGTVSTDMGRDTIASAAGRERAGRIPLRRFVAATEVADAIAFLLSDAAGGITGQTIQLNGGELML
jgi:3-oxoacyl-[acyl-carrier protein] reductase